MISQFSHVLCNTIMTNSDKHKNIFFWACINAKFSEKSLNHKKDHNSDIKRQIGGVSTNCLLDVWEILSFCKYFCPILFHKI